MFIIIKKDNATKISQKVMNEVKDEMTNLAVVGLVHPKCDGTESVSDVVHMHQVC